MCRVSNVLFRHFALTRAYVIAIAMGLLFVAPVSSTLAQGHTVRGHIDQPVDGGRVPGRYEVSGTITHERLPDGYHLWIVVQVGVLMWPKEPEASVKGTSWYTPTPISEGGMGPYRLVLFLVDGTGQRSIKQWLRVGNATGDFRGLRTIIGGRALDSITVQQ
uniref:Uncharacterized protein n=1 Tax=Candidatus Kentrum sp. LPFa TaxID=2126335 RepID=A0A450WLB8_9GAMM|nr:MAG: hypothetical protein BECKLPF1236B_GA0070989_112511 [Candidatus Kentron sp. LPFa]